jgi:PrtD family type I secretion system ABC transporter
MEYVYQSYPTSNNSLFKKCMEKVTPTRTLFKETLDTARRGLYTVVLFSMCINLLMLAAPIYMLQIFDRVLSSRSTDTLLLLTVIIGIAILTMASLEAVRSNIMVRISSWLDRKLAGTVLTGSIALPLKTGQDPTIQGLRDLGVFRTFLSGNEIFPFLDSPWAPIFLIFVYLLHPTLGTVAFIGAIVLFSLAIINETITRPLIAASSSANIKAMQQAEAAVRNADAIEAMGLMPNLIARWNSINSEGVSKQASASYRSGFITSTSKFIRLILQIAMLGIGAWLVINGELTPGGMIAGSILMGRALAPVEQAIGAWKSATAARGAYQRLRLQLYSMPPRAESMELPEPEGQIKVEGVTYIHPGQTEPILRGISFGLEPGEAMGLIGPSAAGKTTLVRLLLGNIVPRMGHARLDGMDVAQWDPEDLGQYCGYVPQDIELFSGTVKENIARMGEGDPKQIVAAAQLAGCHDMILRFSNGYDTPIGESGSALSGGERQRIALARALYGNPKFVVLDEPNANLDAVGEEALLSAVKNLKEKGVTLVVIGHRPNVIQHVDKILVLRQGQVQDFGAREEVLARLTENAKKANVTGIKRLG